MRTSRTPPYLPYPSFKALIAGWSENGLPRAIERDDVQRLDIPARGQVIPTMRFLKLIDEHGRPTKLAHSFVDAFGSQGWKAELQSVLEGAYPSVFKWDLLHISPSEFRDKFANEYATGQQVTRKCVTFFLTAAHEANLEMDRRLASQIKPRTLSVARSRSRHSRGVRWGLGSGKRKIQTFVELFDLNQFEPEEREAFVALLGFLQRQGR